MPSPAKPSPAQFAAAMRRLEAAIAADPGNARARHTLALMLLERDRRAEARAHLEAALTARFAPAAFALGRMAMEDGDLARAESLLQASGSAPALAVDSAFVLAEVLTRQGRRPEAAATLDWVIARNPPSPAPYVNLCDLLIDANADAALTVAEAGLARFAKVPRLLDLYGRALAQLGRHDEAVAAFRRIPGPMPLAVLGRLLDALRQSARWDEEDAVLAELRARLARGERPEGAFAFPAQAFGFDGSELRRISELVMAPFAEVTPLPPRPEPRHEGPLVVGYLSPDFRDHAIAHVFTDTFAAHDPARVRAVAFSVGPDDGSAARAAFVDAARPFVDLSGLSDRAAAERIRAEGTDILVDLALYTRFQRPGIAAHRPAPVQAAWLGLPATTGAPWFRYLLVDDIVAPPAHADRFSETLIRLPHGYHPARRRAPLPPAPPRAELGLPADAVVFACFNARLKIDGDTFAAWMEILAAVPGSVLWLRRAPDAVTARYRDRAAALGVDPARLVFAGRVPNLEDHFARVRQADLMLDCLIYGAHTTCLDALRAGVPMLTVMGDCFAARVGASLLSRAGLPELVMPDRAAFVAEAIRLGNDPAARAGLREKLARVVPASKIFDPEAQARALEDAYAAMWAERRA